MGKEILKSCEGVCRIVAGVLVLVAIVLTSHGAYVVVQEFFYWHAVPGVFLCFLIGLWIWYILQILDKAKSTDKRKRDGVIHLSCGIGMIVVGVISLGVWIPMAWFDWSPPSRDDKDTKYDVDYEKPAPESDPEFRSGGGRSEEADNSGKYTFALGTIFFVAAGIITSVLGCRFCCCSGGDNDVAQPQPRLWQYQPPPPPHSDQQLQANHLESDVGNSSGAR